VRTVCVDDRYAHTRGRDTCTPGRLGVV
jgi:hypothetical protein